MTSFEATATMSNGHLIKFELDEYQIDEFLNAVVDECPYKDEKTGVISWLPPRHLYNIIIKPNLESPKCPIFSTQEHDSELLTSPNQ